MTPLTVNPTVVVRIDSESFEVVDVASNVALDLNVVVVTDKDAYKFEACNKPFDTVRDGFVAPEGTYVSAS